MSNVDFDPAEAQRVVNALSSFAEGLRVVAENLARIRVNVPSYVSVNTEVISTSRKLLRWHADELDLLARTVTRTVNEVIKADQMSWGDHALAFLDKRIPGGAGVLDRMPLPIVPGAPLTPGMSIADWIAAVGDTAEGLVGIGHIAIDTPAAIRDALQGHSNENNAAVQAGLSLLTIGQSALTGNPPRRDVLAQLLNLEMLRRDPGRWTATNLLGLATDRGIGHVAQLGRVRIQRISTPSPGTVGNVSIRRREVQGAERITSQLRVDVARRDSLQVGKRVGLARPGSRRGGGDRFRNAQLRMERARERNRLEFEEAQMRLRIAEQQLTVARRRLLLTQLREGLHQVTNSLSRDRRGPYALVFGERRALEAEARNLRLRPDHVPSQSRLQWIEAELRRRDRVDLANTVMSFVGLGVPTSPGGLLFAGQRVGQAGATAEERRRLRHLEYRRVQRQAARSR